MAAVAPVNTTPMRQPFGVLDGSRLAKLSNVKNRQNGITSMPSSLKRRHASPTLSDSENFDPSLDKSSTKRKRTLQDSDDVFKPSKIPQNKITLVNKPRSILSSVPATRSETPKVNTTFTSSTTPASAPAAAGRSPTSSRRAGLLSRSRRGLSRVESRARSTKSRSIAPPLSLSAALNGTMAYSKPSSKLSKYVPTLEESTPKSWHFEIHEDTHEQEMLNMMGHSTCVLDISDDESRATAKEDRGKENVPPMDASITLTIVPASRRDAMTVEPRTPLGDLKTADFYAEGCDEHSFVTIPGDDASAEKPVTCSIDNIIAGASSTTEITVQYTSASSSLLKKDELDSLIYGNAPPKTEEQHEEAVDDNEDAATDIEIWESGSAKDEALGHDDVAESIFAV